jgi:hypothetical protein
MKLNTSFLIVLVSVVFCSCAADKRLEYFIPNNSVVKHIRKEIIPLKELNREIILVFDREDSLNTITLRPIADRHIQNFSVANSNRYMMIDGHKYTVVFGFDYDLGVKREKCYENGELILKMHKRFNINEYALTLRFDQDWNFLY